jgi:hypothetical protein
LHLLSGAWRPALLLNTPIGASLLLVARRGLPALSRGVRRPLDVAGATLLTLAMVVLVVPLSLGRDSDWPAWIWPCLFGCAVALGAFLGVERHLAERGRGPLFDLSVIGQPGVVAGVVAVTLTMACYAGFLVSLTLHLQTSLRFSPLDAGLIFTAYAIGFATTSIAWTHARPTVRDRLPVVGPLIMSAGLAAIGVVTAGGGWPVAPTTGLLFCAGAGHGCGFSPLASRLTNLVRPAQAADLSGLIITASLVGQVVGVAAFVDLYFSALPYGSAHALALTTSVMAAALLPTAACARSALRRSTTSIRSRTRSRGYRSSAEPRAGIAGGDRCGSCGGD